MAYDATSGEGGRDPHDNWCKSCRQLIEQGQPTERVVFDTHPDMSGVYHKACSKPFSSLARVLNMRLPF